MKDQEKLANIDCTKILIISLIFFCTVAIVSAALLAYFLSGGRTAALYFTTIKDLCLVALGAISTQAKEIVHSLMARNKEDGPDKLPSCT